MREKREKNTGNDIKEGRTKGEEERKRMKERKNCKVNEMGIETRGVGRERSETENRK